MIIRFGYIESNGPQNIYIKEYHILLIIWHYVPTRTGPAQLSYPVSSSTFMSIGVNRKEIYEGHGLCDFLYSFISLLGQSLLLNLMFL